MNGNDNKSLQQQQLTISSLQIFTAHILGILIKHISTNNNNNKQYKYYNNVAFK